MPHYEETGFRYQIKRFFFLHHSIGREDEAETSSLTRSFERLNINTKGRMFLFEGTDTVSFKEVRISNSGEDGRVVEVRFSIKFNYRFTSQVEPSLLYLKEKKKCFVFIATRQIFLHCGSGVSRRPKKGAKEFVDIVSTRQGQDTEVVEIYRGKFGRV